MTKLERIQESITRRILSGALNEGDRLPSEEELATSYRVSVGTVQKALGRLAHSVLISREHGRGTFVSGTSVAPAEVRFLRFRDAAGNVIALEYEATTGRLSTISAVTDPPSNRQLTLAYPTADTIELTGPAGLTARGENGLDRVAQVVATEALAVG